MGARWIDRRALALHGLLVVVVPLCGIAGWWQLHQALSGNSLSWAYTVEWPIFAVIAVVAWWQLLHEDGAARSQRAEQARLDVERMAAVISSDSTVSDNTVPDNTLPDNTLPDVVHGRGTTADTDRVALAARREYQAHRERTR